MQDPGELKRCLLSLAYAENSNASYQSSLRVYESFILKNAYWQKWTEESVAAWLLDGMFNQCWKKNTLRTRMTGIQHQFQVVKGLSFDMAPGSVLQLVARAIARLGDDAEPKQPIKAERLQQILSLLSGRWDAGLRSELIQVSPEVLELGFRRELAAWYTLSFACFFRAEEANSLQWDSVELEDLAEDGMPKSVAVSLATSRFFVYKTTTSSVRIEVGRSSAFDICPVTALCELIQCRVGALQGPMFRVSVEHARKVLQVLAAHVFGKSVKHFGLHSLRSGAACSADESGVNLARIMFMGRWRSAAVLAYLRGDKDGASALLLKGKRQGHGSRVGETRPGFVL